MTPFTDLQNFVVKHTDAKYFEADLKLYKRCFPQSKLITELDRAPEFAKKNLDERICTEILGHPDMCIDTVWEKRGYVLVNGKPQLMEELEKTPDKPVATSSTDDSSKKDSKVELLKTLDLDKTKYNVLKSLVFDLELNDKCENHKGATYLRVLKAYQKEIQTNATPETTSENTIDDTKTPTKKKEAPGASTQE